MIQIKQDSVTAELKGQIVAGFSQYALQKLGADGVREPVAFVAEEGGAFLGAVVVALFWGALHIQYLLVEEVHRGRGVGSQLIRQAIEYGREHGCAFAFVETLSFQVVPFYEGLGFKVDFVRHGYSDGITRSHLSASL